MCRVIFLTPNGHGAVTSILVEGPRAVSLVDQFFRPLVQGSLAESNEQRIVLGHWHNPSAKTSEEIVVCRRSPTTVEIHCHGGQAARHRIQGTLVAAGGCLADWQEWVCDQYQTESTVAARLALARAPTERTAKILIDQLHGAFDLEVEAIVEMLDARQIEQAQDCLEELSHRSDLGLHLTTPWKIVVAGPPNVGKSSLINRLLGYSRLIIHDQPGTTRDLVCTDTAVEGWPIQLVDTAGLRDSDDDLEREGVRLAQREIKQADHVLLVFDGAQLWENEHQQLVETMNEATVVHNKIDTMVRCLDTRPHGLKTSALLGTGIDLVMETIVRKIVPQPPPPGVAIPITAALTQRVRNAQQALKASQLTLASQHLRGFLSP